MREMIAKFVSNCSGCGQTIQKGSDILYDKATKSAYHDNGVCSEKAPAKFEPDRFDMDYEDDCASRCGL